MALHSATARAVATAAARAYAAWDSDFRWATRRAGARSGTAGWTPPPRTRAATSPRPSATAPTAVRPEGDRVLVAHCYTERQLVPLDVYARTAPLGEAAAAIVDYGQAVRDLAVANIFAGDLLLKNFGRTRHGRVIFYDYDELTSLAECRFRALPDFDDEDFAAEPSYGVGAHDVFPEEFARFAVPQGPLREAFAAAHGDLLDPAWWEATQRQLAAGELVETFPYAQHRRLGA